MLQIEVVQRAPHRVRRRGELQAHQMPARLQHAEHLGERARAVGHVADAVCHGERVVARVRIGNVLRIDHLEIDGHAARGAVGVVRSGHVEHLVDQVGALDMARMLRARNREGHIPGAARDVEHVVGRLDGGLLHHSRKPGLVGAETRYGVESLIFLGDGREDVLHAFGRYLGGRFLARCGVDAHGGRAPDVTLSLVCGTLQYTPNRPPSPRRRLSRCGFGGCANPVLSYRD